MRMVDEGEIEACKEQKELMEFLRWKLEQPNVIIDDEAIEKSVEVPAKYFPFKLFAWQRFVNAFIYGVKERKEDGNEKFLFNKFLILIGRGAGKNGYISYNSFFMMSKSHGINNYDIDIIATSEDQAKTSFEDVYNVLDDHWSTLKGAFYRSKTLIQNKSTKSKMEFNTSNAKTKDGKRSGTLIFDEVHEYPDYSNIKVFTSGLGKKPFPRSFYISTNGNIRGGVLDDMLEESRMVLNKELPNSKLFPFICKLDDISEVDNEAMWCKSNPSYPYLDDLQDTMRDEYQAMQTNSALRMEFMTKRMNLPVEDTRKAIATYEEILATNQPIPDSLENAEVIGGIDYAQIRDFASCGILAKHGGKRYWIQHTFMHHTAPKLQAINPDIINLAIKKELLTVVYDESIEASHLLSWFLDISKKYRIKKIATDQFRELLLRETFKDSGLELSVVRRGAATHAMLSPLVEEMFVKKNIVFNDDPLMRWYCGNVYKDEKANGNIEYKKIDKEKRKTDGFFAFLHALNFDSELTESASFNPSMFKTFTF
jgi:phage terminase large subunit-like protein